jgi:hypothetical protein
VHYLRASDEELTGRAGNDIRRRVEIDDPRIGIGQRECRSNRPSRGGSGWRE